MPRLRFVLSRRRALKYALAGATLLGCGISMAPRTIHYIQRANFQRAAEQRHASTAREYRQNAAEGYASARPIDRSLAGTELSAADDEEKTAAHHAQLRLGYQRAAVRFWTCPPRDLPLPYPWDKRRDREVLRTVLLLIRERTIETIGSNDSRGRRDQAIYAHRTTSIGLFENWNVPEFLESNGFPIEVAAHLQRRNAEGEIPLAELELQSPEIVVCDVDEEGRDPSAGVGSVLISLPGYSSDGRLALVGVTKPYAQHGAGTLFAVRLENHKWRIADTYAIHGE
jgi:hypothetical protein